MEINIRNLTKTYPGGVTALENVNLTLKTGMFGLLGPNGAGKTTMMRILATMLEPTEGEVHVVCAGDFADLTGVVDVIDPSSLSVVASIPIGGSPASIAIGPAGIAVIGAGGYVTDGYLYAYDTQTNTVLRDASEPVLVGLGAMGVAIDSDGQAYVACFLADRVDQVDPASWSIARSFLVGDGVQDMAIWEGSA